MSPATYPESYDTIDRRRKKRIRDSGGLAVRGADDPGDEVPPLPDPGRLRRKRGELVLRQVADLEEEEELMTPCLKPYKNGLLYKTRMWAKNRLEDTLENYVAFQEEEEAARLRAGFEYGYEGSEERTYPVGPEEEPPYPVRPEEGRPYPVRPEEERPYLEIGRAHV